MAGPDDATRVGRRTPLRPSWLDRVRDASSAVVGTARDVTDLGATDTSPRSASYGVECELDVEDVLFGEPPPKKARLRGTSSLPPGERDGSGFPPDLLRETPLWDEVEPGASARALVLFGGDAPIARSLATDDPLPGDVRDIRKWVEAHASVSDVTAGLGARAAGPVAFAAGFHLLVSEGADPAETFTAFLAVPRKTEAALAGVVERLRIDASGEEDVAEALLKGWEDERDPATLVAYITWFDASHAHVPGLRDSIARLAERDASFDGGDSAWNEEVRRRAEALRAELG